MRTRTGRRFRSRDWLLLGGMLALTSCLAPRAEPVASRGEQPLYQSLDITVEDLAAYRRGLAEEAAVARDRLREVENSNGRSLEEAGAVAAGVSPVRFRLLQATVDSLLRSRTPRRGALAPQAALVSPAADSAFGRMADELDSIRVELIVLRVRLSEQGRLYSSPSLRTGRASHT